MRQEYKKRVVPRGRVTVLSEIKDFLSARFKAYSYRTTAGRALRGEIHPRPFAVLCFCLLFTLGHRLAGHILYPLIRKRSPRKNQALPAVMYHSFPAEIKGAVLKQGLLVKGGIVFLTDNSAYLERGSYLSQKAESLGKAVDFFIAEVDVAALAKSQAIVKIAEDEFITACVPAEFIKIKLC